MLADVGQFPCGGTVVVDGTVEETVVDGTVVVAEGGEVVVGNVVGDVVVDVAGNVVDVVVDGGTTVPGEKVTSTQ